MKKIFFSIQFIVCLLTLFIHLDSFSARPFCESILVSYDHKIRLQIEKGIPFDLVVMLRSASKDECKTVLNFKYDLWKESVTLKKQGSDTLLGPWTLMKTRESLCGLIQCLSNGDKSHINLSQPIQVRILLNPLWEGHSKGLIRSKENSMVRFFKLEWDELSQDLPKDVDIMNESVLL